MSEDADGWEFREFGAHSQFVEVFNPDEGVALYLDLTDPNHADFTNPSPATAKALAAYKRWRTAQALSFWN